MPLLIVDSREITERKLWFMMGSPPGLRSVAFACVDCKYMQSEASSMVKSKETNLKVSFSLLFPRCGNE